jgi:hypothetical protein
MIFRKCTVVRNLIEARFFFKRGTYLMDFELINLKFKEQTNIALI